MTEYVAKFRPSSAVGWMNCPHWIADETESEYAVEGTLLHDRVHKMLQGSADWSSGLTEDQVEAVAFAYLAVQQEESVFDGSELDVYYEKSWSLASVTGEAQARGTADVVIACRKTKSLVVLDHKFGFAPVPVEHNSQLQIYAAAIIDELGFADVENILLIISQPKLKRVARWEITRKELDDFRPVVRQKVEQYGQGEFNPGTAQCKYCKRAGQCDAQDRMVLANVTDDFPHIEETDRLLTQVQAVIDAMPEASPEHLSRMSKVAPLVVQWAQAVNDRTLSVMMQGVTVPDFKLVLGRQGNRQWADEKTAESFLAQSIGTDKLYEVKLISPTKAEKLVPKETRGQMNDLVVRSPAKPQVAPVSDKRPAIDVSTFPIEDDSK